MFNGELFPPSSPGNFRTEERRLMRTTTLRFSMWKAKRFLQYCQNKIQRRVEDTDLARAELKEEKEVKLQRPPIRTITF